MKIYIIIYDYKYVTIRYQGSIISHQLCMLHMRSYSG